MDFDKLIKNLETEKPKDKEEAKELEDNLKVFGMLKKIKEKKVRTKSDFKKAFTSLCFNSIAFCCDKRSSCLCRNAVLDALSISMGDYTKIKKKWNTDFIEVFLKD